MRSQRGLKKFKFHHFQWRIFTLTPKMSRGAVPAKRLGAPSQAHYLRQGKDCLDLCSVCASRSDSAAYIRAKTPSEPLSRCRRNLASWGKVPYGEVPTPAPISIMRENVLEAVMREFTLNINGADHRVSVADDEMLLYVLRDRLNLTGTKYGCGEGQCGACTVLIDGHPTRSCQMHARAIADRKITTTEGLETNGNLHPVQR